MTLFEVLLGKDVGSISNELLAYSLQGCLVISSISKVFEQCTNVSSSMYPGHAYIPLFALNRSLPPPHAPHFGILPSNFPSATRSISSALVPVVFCSFFLQICLSSSVDKAAKLSSRDLNSVC